MKPAETLSVAKWQQELQAAAQPGKTAILSSFFKTGKGEYGEGDTFIGVTVPANRAVSRRYAWLSLDEISEMIDSEVHEFRLGGMLALVERYRKARTDADRNAVVDFYLANGHKANNWDLVDLSSPYILGAEIAAGRRTGQIDRLIASGNLWRQRIAMVSMLNPSGYNIVLAAYRTGVIQSHICGIYAENGSVFYKPSNLSAAAQGFCGYAPPVQACAAEFSALNQHNIRTLCGGFGGGFIAAGSGAYDNYVCFCHPALFLSSFHVTVGLSAAAVSSGRLTGVVCGAVFTTSGFSAASRAMSRMAFMKQSRVSLLSVSVGSIISDS